MATLRPNAPAPFRRSASDFRAAPSTRRRGLAFSALSGLLLIGAFPALDWGWLAWVALVPLLLTFSQCTRRDALWNGFVFGLVFFGGLISWLDVFAGHAIGPALGGVAWIGATLAQAGVMWCFAGWASALHRSRNVWAWRLGVPALWAVLEWMRQLGALGTGWGDLAYAQHKSLLILQVTKLTGVWGLSFLIVLVNVTLAELIEQRKIGRFPVATAALIVAALAFGGITLSQEQLRPNFTAAALQGNVDPNVVWSNGRPESPVYVRRVMDTYHQMGQQSKAAFVVWPETTFPGFLLTDEQLRGEVARDALQNKQAVLVGGRAFDALAKQETNTAFTFNPMGLVSGQYSKQQLVPFGEFVPFHQYLPVLRLLHLAIYDMKPGAPNQPLSDGGATVGKVGIAVCYESSYGWLTREQVARGAGILAVITDDCWFGHTAAASQHASIAAVRAAESDRYLIRSAATGISQVIDPTGKVIAEAGLFRQAIVAAPVQSRTTITPYVRWGDWFIWACFLILVGIVGAEKRPRLA